MPIGGLCKTFLNLVLIRFHQQRWYLRRTRSYGTTANFSLHAYYEYI
jgi:hypothetical protein